MKTYQTGRILTCSLIAIISFCPIVTKAALGVRFDKNYGFTNVIVEVRVFPGQPSEGWTAMTQPEINSWMAAHASEMADYIQAHQLLEAAAVSNAVFVAAQKALLELKERTLTVVDADDFDGRLLRATAEMMLDEINLHATRTTQILDAVDAATSLSDLKTRVAAIPDVPQRTAEQLKTAIKAKLSDD